MAANGFIEGRMKRLALVAVLALAATVLAWFFVWRAPLPPLARDLPSSGDIASQEFSQRIKQRFPLATAEQDVLSELVSQGFQVQQRDAAAGTSAVIFEQGGFPCKHVWYIWWQADGAGHLTSIDAKYADVCV